MEGGDLWSTKNAYDFCRSEHVVDQRSTYVDQRSPPLLLLEREADSSSSSSSSRRRRRSSSSSRRRRRSSSSSSSSITTCPCFEMLTWGDCWNLFASQLQVALGRPIVAPSTGWMLHYLCHPPRALQNAFCDRECACEALTHLNSHPHSGRITRPPHSKLLSGLRGWTAR